MAATIKSMTKYLSLVEGQAKAAEEVLNQVPQGQQPSPRLFKRLEKVEEALEATPLWLRRLNYFNCSQNQNETVAQFWSRKRDLASQCDLIGMKTEDIEIMELIRNVHAPALRTKFLEVKDPKVPQLLQSAANWA